MGDVVVRGGTACGYCWWQLCCADDHRCKEVVGNNAGAVVEQSTVLAGMLSIVAGKMRLAGGRLYVRWMGDVPGVVEAGGTPVDRWEVDYDEVESLGGWLQALVVAGNIETAHIYVSSWACHEIECHEKSETVCAKTLYCVLAAAAFPGAAADFLSSIQRVSGRGTSLS